MGLSSSLKIENYRSIISRWFKTAAMAYWLPIKCS
jgi:hypothetical protein